MSIYTLIERELVDINEAKFELICNAFLSHEYRGDLQSPGTVKGKEKTRKGKPDAFIIQKDGSYIVAEYTTRSKSDNRNTFFKKLHADITGCLNFDKLGINASQVAMVVLCCNSNLSISEIEDLKRQVTASNIRIRIVGIDSLALFLFSKGRYYAHQHFNIPFDTGQILNKGEFLKFYSKRNLATPLNNHLVGRQKELSTLVELINCHNVLIVSGQPDVGKSKICLEAIHLFLQQQPKYLDYYIVSKTGSLLEDLKGILEQGKKYIFFVDDANRQIGNLLNILYSSSDNYNILIKIIITVRNYAQEQVLSVCNTLQPAIFHLHKMPKKNIAEIIREQDSNNQLAPYLNRIIEVSDGNPRIAIMSAHIVKHEQNPKLLNDVSLIYDQYFQTIVADKKIFADPDVLKTLGIISFFHSLDLASEKLRILLSDFNIPYEKFIELVFVLEEAEFVEVYLKNIVRISEQMLATFAFYKTFIQERLLDFGTLLSKYCQRTFTTIKDIMGPVYFSFGEKQALDNIKGILISYFNSHKKNFENCLGFLGVFGTSIPDQALLFVGRHCSQMSTTSKSSSNSAWISSMQLEQEHPILTVLFPIIKNGSGTEVLSATALCILYAEKVPDTYEAILDKLTWRLHYTEKDVVNDANRQKAVYHHLHAQLGKSDTVNQTFFDLFGNILLSNYKKKAYYIRTASGWTISAPLMQLRQLFWQDMYNCFTTHVHLCRIVIKDYITRTPRKSVTLLRYDEPYLAGILLSYFRQDSFEDCRLVYTYLDIVNVYYPPSDRLLQLKQHFHNSAAIVFCTLSAADPFSSPMEYGWEMNESKIRTLIIDSMDDFKYIYNLLLESLPYWREIDKMHYTLAFMITALIEKDLDLGLAVLQFVIGDGNKLRICASRILKSLSDILQERFDQVYDLIRQKEFYGSDDWVYEFFSNLTPVASTEYLLGEAIEYFSTGADIGIVYNHHFNNFQDIDKEIHERILLLLYARVERGDKFNYELSESFFTDNKLLVKKHFNKCKRLYFDLKKRITGSQGYDHHSEVLFTLYEVDPNILFDYLGYLETTSDFTNHEDYRPLLTIIWNYDNAAVSMEKVIIRYKSIQDFEPLGHVCCIFFNYLQKDDYNKVETFLRAMVDKYSSDSEILNIILDIARNCVKDSYIPLVQHFFHTNDDFNIFKSIFWFTRWDDHYDETSVREAEAFKLSEIQEAIKELGEPIRFIEHTEYLTQKIHQLQESIAEYKKWNFMDDRYGRERQKLRYF
jgi:hypothetical protein